MDIDAACPSRRAMLRGLAAMGGLVVLPGVLVACSSDDNTDTRAQDTGAQSGGSGATSQGSGTEGGSTASGSTVPAAEVPTGSARVVDAGGQRVVVAQPTEGEFVAFSAVCTHQGTIVDVQEGLLLKCPNHGSEFDAGDDGAVLQGPATEPLPSIPVTVDGDRLVLG